MKKRRCPFGAIFSWHQSFVRSYKRLWRRILYNISQCMNSSQFKLDWLATSYTCSRKMLFFVAALCALTTLIDSAQNVCHIGNDGERQVARSDDESYLYLDIHHPASCAGIITSWRLCYYIPMSVDTEGSKQTSRSNSISKRTTRSQSRNEYWATFAVYRRTDDGGYARVSSRFSSTTSMHSISHDHACSII